MLSPSSVDLSSHSEDQGGSLLCADGGSILARKALVTDLIPLIQCCPWQLPARADRWTDLASKPDCSALVELTLWSPSLNS